MLELIQAFVGMYALGSFIGFGGRIECDNISLITN